MILLHTGLPGASKTLYTLSYVKHWAEKENRPVFYAGIKDLMLPWTEIDPVKWFECPPGSIIVIDECQTVFRPRSFGSNVPDYVAKLETHRHSGFDIVLITQHPMLCDPSIRRLAGKHVHIVRKFGMHASTLHEWASVRENCDKPSGRTDSIKHHWKFDKKAFGYYKSAELHTVKRNIPFRLIVLFVFLPALIAFLGWRFYSSLQARVGDEAPAAALNASASARGSYSPSASPGVSLDPIADARQYLFNATPRIAGLEYTAPKYDSLTKPDSVPVPAACMLFEAKKRCQCYSQQATPLNLSYSHCVDIAKYGYFQEFDPSKNAEGGGNFAAVHPSASVMPAYPSASASDPAARAPASMDGYGVNGKAGPGVRTPQL